MRQHRGFMLHIVLWAMSDDRLLGRRACARDFGQKLPRGGPPPLFLRSFLAFLFAFEGRSLRRRLLFS